MQAFVDEAGDFSGRSRFSVIAGLALPEVRAVAEKIGVLLATIDREARSEWRRHGEVKGSLIPDDELRRLLCPISSIDAPLLAVVVVIDHERVSHAEVLALRDERLALLSPRVDQGDPTARRQFGLLKDTGASTLLDVLVGLPEVARNFFYLMHPCYRPEFHDSLRRLELVCDENSFFATNSDRKSKTRTSALLELVRERFEAFLHRWGSWHELKQWHDQGLRHPMERIERSTGQHVVSLPLTISMDSDFHERPLLMLGDLLATAYKRDLDRWAKGTFDRPIFTLRYRTYASLPLLGIEDEQRLLSATSEFGRLFLQWGMQNEP